MLVNNEWVNEIKEGIKRHFETNENEDTIIQNWGHLESNPKREFKALQAYLKKEKKRKSSNKLSNFTHKRIWKRTIDKVQSE